MLSNLEVIAALRDAAARPQLVAVELRDGQHFQDGVCEVFSGCGTEFVIFHAHNRVIVDDIMRCEPILARRDRAADA